MIKILPVHPKHIRGFHSTLDLVASEGKYLAATKGFPLKDVRKFVRNIIKRKFTQFMVLDRDKVVGWCDIVPRENPTAEQVGVLGMGLLREYRGKGIGAKLLRKTLRHAKSRGLELVRLEVYASNRAAIRLYRRSGFNLIGIQRKARKHKRKYDDILMMSKEFK